MHDSRSLAPPSGASTHKAKMTIANVVTINLRAAADDPEDQIGSNSSTPPGAATPRPDPTDKRLPGILHTYFGQVCDSFRTRPKSASTASTTVHTMQSPSVAATQGTIAAEEKSSRTEKQSECRNNLPTAPSSPRSMAADRAASLLPHQRADNPPLPGPSRKSLSYFYPTPPTSSSSSIHKVSPGGGEAGAARPPRDLPSRARSVHGKRELSGALPPRSRRHTFAVSNPLSSINTTPVPAPHISNPATPTSTRFPHSNVSPPSASRRSSASRSKEVVKKLTESAQPLSQNTPPQTPRTRSHEGKAASTPSGQTNSAAVRPPKGKLTVTISEGRNIKPSVDPYVVCQFQWAEYISEGPKNNDLGKQLAEGLGRNGSPALAIKRTDSDMGRPMAIPMRSRQSSNSGQSSDPKDPSFGRLTSNPRWDHKAIL